MCIWCTQLCAQVTTPHAWLETPLTLLGTSQSQNPARGSCHPPLEYPWPRSKSRRPGQESLRPALWLCWTCQPCHSTCLSPAPTHSESRGLGYGTGEQDAHSLAQEYELQPRSPRPCDFRYISRPPKPSVPPHTGPCGHGRTRVGSSAGTRSPHLSTSGQPVPHTAWYTCTSRGAAQPGVPARPGYPHSRRLCPAQARAPHCRRPAGPARVLSGAAPASPQKTPLSGRLRDRPAPL